MAKRGPPEAGVQALLQDDVGVLVARRRVDDAVRPARGEDGDVREVALGALYLEPGADGVDVVDLQPVAPAQIERVAVHVLDPGVLDATAAGTGRQVERVAAAPPEDDVLERVVDDVAVRLDDVRVAAPVSLAGAVDGHVADAAEVARLAGQPNGRRRRFVRGVAQRRRPDALALEVRRRVAVVEVGVGLDAAGLEPAAAELDGAVVVGEQVRRYLVGVLARPRGPRRPAPGPAGRRSTALSRWPPGSSPPDPTPAGHPPRSPVPRPDSTPDSRRRRPRRPPPASAAFVVVAMSSVSGEPSPPQPIVISRLIRA